MSDIAIRVQNLGKRYRIGQFVGYKTLRESLMNTITSPFRRSRAAAAETKAESQNSNDEYIWALRDASFEVKPGEAVGIIGPNGAGKTTLLRILTRITPPTEGSAAIRGRVGSLLEVGTGFHPELTGRENVYLNGTILGMKRRDIDRNFDEIVDFSGVERFIDTPLKRFSSGMQVRLAFSVAAHLEPDILLVDEVLAVGDANFQKKCLGKMEDVAKGGRTVLFVSHNMGAIQNLCPRTLLLTDGRLVKDGKTQDVVEEYLSSHHNAVIESRSLYDLPRDKGLGEDIRISKCLVLDSSANERYSLLLGEPFSIYIEAIAKTNLRDLSVSIGIDSVRGERITTISSEDRDMLFSVDPSQPLRVVARFNDLVLAYGVYWLTITIHGLHMCDILSQVIKLEVLQVADEGAASKGFRAHGGSWGYIHTAPKWETAEQGY